MKKEEFTPFRFRMSTSSLSTLIPVEIPLPTVGNLRTLASGKPKWRGLGIDCQKR